MILFPPHNYFGPTTTSDEAETQGQNGSDQGGATTALSQALYRQEIGGIATVSLNDAHQGQFGEGILNASIGQLATEAPSALTQAGLKMMLAAGDLIITGTNPSSHRVSLHTSMMEAMTNSAMGQLGNPGGTKQPAAFSLAQFAKAAAEIDARHFR